MRLRQVEQKGRVARQLVGLLEIFDRLLPAPEVVLAPAALSRLARGVQLRLRPPRRRGRQEKEGDQQVSRSVQFPLLSAA